MFGVISLNRHSSTICSLRGPGGLVRGLDSLNYKAKVCSRELASVVSRGLQGASRGLPLATGRTIYIVLTVYIGYWGYNSIMFKHISPQELLSGHAQTFPPGDRNLHDCSLRLRLSRAQAKQLPKANAWIRSPCNIFFFWSSRVFHKMSNQM